MGAFKMIGKTLEYAGKITQAEGFEEWAKSQGRAVVEKTATGLGLKFFKQSRASKALLVELKAAASSKSLSDAIAKLASEYPKWLGEIAGLSGWPNKASATSTNTVMLVQRLFLNQTASRKVTKALSKSEELSRMPGGTMLAEYFFELLVREMGAALSKVKVDPTKPFEIEKSIYRVVGIDASYEWITGEELGHYYLAYENRDRAYYSATVEKENLHALSGELGVWSKAQRDQALARMAPRVKAYVDSQ